MTEGRGLIEAEESAAGLIGVMEVGHHPSPRVGFAVVLEGFTS